MKFKANIDKLKILTESLVDRDSMRTKILKLFDLFCNDFPIPMNAWITNSNLDIIAKKGSLIPDKQDKRDIRDIFQGNAREKNILMHKKALSGEIVTYIISDREKTFLTKLMPSPGDHPAVLGISMDITSFVNMKNVIDTHCNDISGEECNLIKKIDDDELYKILKSVGV